MACSRCQQSTWPMAHFCHVCGLMLRPFCQLCRIELPENAHFCFHCGHALGLAQLGGLDSALKNSEISVTNPTTHPTSSAVSANPTKQASENIDAERKLVSILFADLTGFTAMSEKMDPEQITNLMNYCFQRLGACVSRNEGYIDKFMGDCIMVLFGAPVAHENDPELAIKTAVEMIAELEMINAEKNLNLRVRIGINAGMVVAGAVGSDQKVQYTVMGDAVNLAQRLQTAAEPNQILVSRSIYQSGLKRYAFLTLPPVQVKGKKEAVEVFAVEKALAISDAPANDDIGLIGRDNEIKHFEKVLDLARSGKGQVSCVSGEAGLGKSRFKQEIRKLAAERSMEWYEASTLALNKETPYFLFSNFLQRFFQNRSDKNPLSILESYGVDESSQDALLDLLHLNQQREDLKVLDIHQKKRRMFVALKNLFQKLSEVSASVFYFEDLQWVDPVSHELLSELIDVFVDRPALIYGTFRARDFKHQWNQKPQYSELELKPFNAEQTLHFTRALLGHSEIPDSLKQLVLMKAEGNPLFIEEIIKNLRDSKKIMISEKGVEVLGNLNEGDIPPTLQGLISSRIDRLSENEKKITQIASVIGKTFSESILMKVSQQGNSARIVLDSLRQKDLIKKIESKSHEILFAFQHALVHEVAYQSILHQRRHQYHQAVADSLEADLKDDQDIGLLETLTHHYLLAENSQKAIRYLLLSAKNMAENFNNLGAIQNYKKAIRLIECQQGENDEHKLFDAYIELAEVYTNIADFDSAQAHLEKVGNSPKAQENLNVLCLVYRRLGDIERLRGNFKGALELLNQALKHAHQSGNFDNQVRTFKALANANKLSRNLERASEFIEDALEGARHLGDKRLTAECLNDSAVVFIELNRLEEAQERLQECIDLCGNHTALKGVLATVQTNLGVVEYMRNRFEEALALWKRAAEISREIGNLVSVVLCRHNSGEVLVQFARFSEALEAFQESSELARKIGSDMDEMNSTNMLGYVYAKLGQIQRAEEILRKAWRHCETKNYRRFAWDAAYYLAEILSGRGAHQEALDFLEKAKVYAQDLKDAGLQTKTEEAIKLNPANAQSSLDTSSSSQVKN